MAWGKVDVLEQKKKLIEMYLSDQYSITDLSRYFQISRPTAYKWINSFLEYGVDGLEELSRAPYHHPNQTPRNYVEQILEVRNRFPRWGSEKILAHLKRQFPLKAWPSDTTIHNILEREGFVTPRHVRRRVSPVTTSLTNATDCNHVWCIDFKGWCLTDDGLKFEPLTLTDNHSRYLIHCTSLPSNNTKYVWYHLDHVFREYGRPLFLRSDNGAPFGSTGVGRLCKLAINLIKAGVTPEWITPGKPQENGRHERMHRTLKAEIASPPANTLLLQQERLRKFQYEYNNLRPHQALGQVPPAMIYQKSPREWDGILREPEYHNDYRVCKVHPCGKIYLKGDSIYIGRVLEKEHVGIKEIEEGLKEVYYGPILIGFIDRKNDFVRPSNPSKRKPKNIK
jgi:putative transposase